METGGVIPSTELQKLSSHDAERTEAVEDRLLEPPQSGKVRVDVQRVEVPVQTV